MSKITLDSDLRAKLNGLQQPLEFCDESGQSLGHFLPADTYRQYLYAWLKSQVSDEELEELTKQEGGSTLAEFWQRMGRV
jgi:hypothetical protein